MKSYRELLESSTCTIISHDQLRDLEKFADRLLEKFKIDIEFTKHFGERMSDSRNKPCISVSELQNLFKKIQGKEGKPLTNRKDGEVVVKDIQRDLNIPVVIDYKNGEFEVRLKTIMRKKNFYSPDPVVKY